LKEQETKPGVSTSENKELEKTVSKLSAYECLASDELQNKCACLKEMNYEPSVAEKSELYRRVNIQLMSRDLALDVYKFQKKYHKYRKLFEAMGESLPVCNPLDGLSPRSSTFRQVFVKPTIDYLHEKLGLEDDPKIKRRNRRSLYDFFRAKGLRNSQRIPMSRDSIVSAITNIVSSHQVFDKDSKKYKLRRYSRDKTQKVIDEIVNDHRFKSEKKRENISKSLSDLSELLIYTFDSADIQESKSFQTKKGLTALVNDSLGAYKSELTEDYNKDCFEVSQKMKLMANVDESVDEATKGINGQLFIESLSTAGKSAVAVSLVCKALENSFSELPMDFDQKLQTVLNYGNLVTFEKKDGDYQLHISDRLLGRGSYLLPRCEDGKCEFRIVRTMSLNFVFGSDINNVDKTLLDLWTRSGREESFGTLSHVTIAKSNTINRTFTEFDIPIPTISTIKVVSGSAFSKPQDDKKKKVSAVSKAVFKRVSNIVNNVSNNFDKDPSSDIIKKLGKKEKIVKKDIDDEEKKVSPKSNRSGLLSYFLANNSRTVSMPVVTFPTFSKKVKVPARDMVVRKDSAPVRVTGVQGSFSEPYSPETKKKIKKQMIDMNYEQFLNERVNRLNISDMKVSAKPKSTSSNMKTSKGQVFSQINPVNDNSNKLEHIEASYKSNDSSKNKLNDSKLARSPEGLKVNSFANSQQVTSQGKPSGNDLVYAENPTEEKRPFKRPKHFAFGSDIEKYKPDDLLNIRDSKDLFYVIVQKEVNHITGYYLETYKYTHNGSEYIRELVSSESILRVRPSGKKMEVMNEFFSLKRKGELR
jgi:hypothetical protein